MNRKLANLAVSGLALVLMTGAAMAPSFAEARDRDSNSGFNRGGGNRDNGGNRGGGQSRNDNTSNPPAPWLVPRRPPGLRLRQDRPRPPAAAANPTTVRHSTTPRLRTAA